MSGDPMGDLRNEIDHIDEKLLELLNQRVRAAQEIGRIKGLDQQPFFNPERERFIFERLKERNQGPLGDEQVRAVFREIISAARAAEKPLTVAFWGPVGTFTHGAARETFGSLTHYMACDSISEVFEAVEHRKADYGVVPVENSVAGVVPETLDTFLVTNVKICAETYQSISHHLVSTASSLGDIKRVFAGPQPAFQCRKWLRSHLPQAEIIDVQPTAKAAKMALEDPESAAIANRSCAELMNVPILMGHIEDNPHNKTRFLVVGFNQPAKTGNDKTSLLFNLRNRPGELYHALGAFVKHDVNLLMIESRPAQRAGFEYIFYVDCEGHHGDEHLQSAIEVLRPRALEILLLGSYPIAPIQTP